MTYVLIPGAGGSAWYWHLLDAELRQRGHDVVLVDLPADDDTAGLPEYTETVIAAIEDRTELVLVAQSMGAFTASLVCERLPSAVSELVLLNAMIPRTGETPGEWWANTGQPEAQRENDLRDGRPADAPFDYLTMFFHDVPQEVIDEAGRHNRRQSDTPFAQQWPLSEWPDVPTRVLVGRDDRLFPAEFQRQVARARLGITPDEVPGGHLAALSHPNELADHLEGTAFQQKAASVRRSPAVRRPATRPIRRARQSTEMVLADLDRLISAVIEENRQLRRQVDKLQRQASGATPGSVERALRSLQRRISRTLGSEPRTPRRRSSPVSRRGRQALVKARETRAPTGASS